MRWKLPQPTKRARAWTRRALWLLPLAYALYVIGFVLAAPGPRMMAIEGDVRFGFDEAERRAIYAEIARHRGHWEHLASDTFPEHDWSRHDDFHNHLRQHVLMLAERHHLHYSEVFMIYDEGVRKHWTGPDGQTLPARWVPLEPRIE